MSAADLIKGDVFLRGDVATEVLSQARRGSRDDRAAYGTSVPAGDVHAARQHGRRGCPPTKATGQESSQRPLRGRADTRSQVFRAPGKDRSNSAHIQE